MAALHVKLGQRSLIALDERLQAIDVITLRLQTGLQVCGDRRFINADYGALRHYRATIDPQGFNMGIGGPSQH